MCSRNILFRLTLLQCAALAVVAFVPEQSQQAVCNRQEASSSSSSTSTGRSSPLYAISREPTPAQRAIQKVNQEKENETTNGGFDQFKKALYQGVDSFQFFKSPTSKEESKVIAGGYSEKEGLKIRSKDLTSGGKTNEPPSRQSGIFNTAKGAFYATIDAATGVGKVEKKESTDNRVESLPVVVERRSPKNNLVSPRLLAELEPDLESTNPLTRAAAELKLWDLERKELARRRSLETQETIRKVKETVYRFGDGVTAGVNAIIGLPDKLAQGLESTGKLIQTIPVTTKNAVDTVTAIPEKVQKTAAEVQETVDTTIATTKQVIQDVQAIPDKVQKKAKETVEVVNEVTTNTKILLGLQQPKPRPPKLPPPLPLKPATSTDIGLQVAGAIATGTGKALWFVGKGLLQLTGAAVTEGAKALQEQLKAASVPKLKPASESSPSTDKGDIVKSIATTVPVPPVVGAVSPPPASAKSATTIAPPIVTAASASAVVEAPSQFDKVIPKPPSTAAAETTTLNGDVVTPKPPPKDSDLDRQVKEALRLAAEALDAADDALKQ